MPKKNNDFLTGNRVQDRAKRAVTYPARATRTAATKIAAGPDQFRKRRAENPKGYLTDKELEGYKPRKRK